MRCRIMCHGRLTILLIFLVMVSVCAGAPTVSSINGQLQGVYGRVDGNDLRAGGASLTLPLGSPFGLQIDWAYGNIDEDQLKGIGLQFFVGEPERYRCGLLADHAELQDIDINRLGVEGELYLGQVTLSVQTGHQKGDVANTAFGVADLRWYPGNNLMLILGGNLADGDDNKLHLGTEYQMVAGLSAYIDLAFGENDYDHALAGLRYYFGGKKDLIQRHRQDAVSNPIVTNVLQGLNSIREKQGALARVEQMAR